MCFIKPRTVALYWIYTSIAYQALHGGRGGEGAIWEEQMPWRAPCDHFLNEGLPPPSLGRAQCIWSHTNVFEFSSGSAFLRSWLRILFNRDRLCGWSYQPIYQHCQAPKSMNRRRLNGGGTSSASNDFESHSECPAGLGWGREGLVHICSHHTSSSYFYC